MIPRLLMVAPVLIFAAACNDDIGEDATSPTDEAASSAAPTTDACDWLTPDEIFDATGLDVERTVPTAEGCTWDLSEEAAVQAGPNAGEEAVLGAEVVSRDRFDAARDDASESDELDDLGDDAFIVYAEDESDTTIFVDGGSASFSLNLAGALDGRSANTTALRQMSEHIAARL